MLFLLFLFIFVLYFQLHGAIFLENILLARVYCPRLSGFGEEGSVELCSLQSELWRYEVNEPIS